MDVEKKIRDLVSECDALSEGLTAILDARSLLRPLLSQLLCAGNCMNAGKSKLNRADGFDVIHLLEKTGFLENYKFPGKTGTTLLQYLAEVSLNSENRKAFKELGDKLVKMKTDSGAADIARARTRNGDVNRGLGDLERTWLS